VVALFPQGDCATSRAPWRIYNIGNHTPVELMEVVHLLEQALGKTALKEMLPMQPGDVRATSADVDALQKTVGFAPNTPIADGIRRFIDWYRAYYLE
jgi:UDP-glucuronate 4-epimerase